MPALSNDITVTINKFCAGGLLAPSAVRSRQLQEAERCKKPSAARIGARTKRKHSQEEMS
jgi:hypothetical protein